MMSVPGSFLCSNTTILVTLIFSVDKIQPNSWFNLDFVL